MIVFKHVLLGWLVSTVSVFLVITPVSYAPFLQLIVLNVIQIKLPNSISQTLIVCLIVLFIHMKMIPNGSVLHAYNLVTNVTAELIVYLAFLVIFS